MEGLEGVQSIPQHSETVAQGLGVVLVLGTLLDHCAHMKEVQISFVGNANKAGRDIACI